MKDIRHAFTMKCVTPVRQSEDKHQHFGRQNCMELMEICFSTATSQRSQVRTCTHVLYKQLFYCCFPHMQNVPSFTQTPLFSSKWVQTAQIGHQHDTFPFSVYFSVETRLECNLGLINYRLAAPGLTFVSAELEF